MLNDLTDTSSTLSKIVRDLLAERDKAILDQLNELIERDLLVVEYGPMTLIKAVPEFRHEKELDYPKIELRQTVKLKLKEQEYIMKLEAENKKMKEIIDKLKMYNP
jgi:hypothetical protein